MSQRNKDTGLPNPSELEQHNVKQLLKEASNPNKSPLMRGEKIIEKVEDPIGNLMNQNIIRQRRIDLKRLLPSTFWKKIEVLGPPDVNKDPREQRLNCTISYLVIYHVRTQINQPDDPSNTILKEYERAEGVWYDVFSKLIENGIHQDSA